MNHLKTKGATRTRTNQPTGCFEVQRRCVHLGRSCPQNASHVFTRNLADRQEWHRYISPRPDRYPMTNDRILPPLNTTWPNTATESRQASSWISPPWPAYRLAWSPSCQMVVQAPWWGKDGRDTWAQATPPQLKKPVHAHSSNISRAICFRLSYISFTNVTSRYAKFHADPFCRTSHHSTVWKGLSWHILQKPSCTENTHASNRREHSIRIYQTESHRTSRSSSIMLNFIYFFTQSPRLIHSLMPGQSVDLEVGRPCCSNMW